jgi:hypothetical protein
MGGNIKILETRYAIRSFNNCIGSVFLICEMFDFRLWTTLKKHSLKCSNAPYLAPSTSASISGLDLGGLDNSQDHFRSDQLIFAESLEGSAIYVFDGVNELL